MRHALSLLVPLALVGCAHSSAESATAVPPPAPTLEAAPPAVASEAPASAGQLVPFHSAGGFTVLMPASPTQENRTEDAPGGKVQIHVAKATDPAARYVSTYTEFPAGTLERVQTRDLLDAFQRSTVEAMKGTVVRTRDVQVDGLPGREFTASDASGGQLTARLMIAPGRVYSLAGTYPQGPTPESVERFLGSFARSRDAVSSIGGSGPASETVGDAGPKSVDGTLADPAAVSPAPVKRSGRTRAVPPDATAGASTGGNR